MIQANSAREFRAVPPASAQSSVVRGAQSGQVAAFGDRAVAARERSSMSKRVLYRVPALHERPCGTSESERYS